jgi:ketosteroid isomerase-like protein
MKRTLLIAAIAAVVANLSYAQAEESFDVAKATSIIEQRSEEFDQALIAKDAEAVGQLYTVDTKIIPHLLGRDAVIGSAKRLIENGESLRLSIINLWGDDNIIVEDAAVEFYKVDSGEITGTGQALLVWKNDGGQWWIFRDVFKPNRD